MSQLDSHLGDCCGLAGAGSRPASTRPRVGARSTNCSSTATRVSGQYAILILTILDHRMSVPAGYAEKLVAGALAAPEAEQLAVCFVRRSSGWQDRSACRRCPRTSKPMRTSSTGIAGTPPRSASICGPGFCGGSRSKPQSRRTGKNVLNRGLRASVPLYLEGREFSARLC